MTLLDLARITTPNPQPVTKHHACSITAEQLSVLKAKDRKARSIGTRTRIVVISTMSGLIADVLNAIYRPIRRYPMCEHYGHVFDVANQPIEDLRCLDCGVEITMDSPVRTATRAT